MEGLRLAEALVNIDGIVLVRFLAFTTFSALNLRLIVWSGTQWRLRKQRTEPSRAALSSWVMRGLCVFARQLHMCLVTKHHFCLVTKHHLCCKKKKNGGGVGLLFVRCLLFDCIFVLYQ